MQSCLCEFLWVCDWNLQELRSSGLLANCHLNMPIMLHDLIARMVMENVLKSRDVRKWSTYRKNDLLQKQK